MGRSARPWWLALAVSLLLHAGLLGGLTAQLPQLQASLEPPAIEARLVQAPPPSPPAVKPAPRPPSPRPAPPPEPVVEPVAEAVPEVLAEAAPTPEPPLETATPAPASAAVAEPVPPPLNPLPPRLHLRYQLRYGLAAGEQTLLWVSQGERYTLTSVAAATGLTGMFYRGRFVQTSSGRITPQGLQPEEFWDQRGEKRSSARFDNEQGHLTLTPEKGAPRHFTYSGPVQDALSLLVHLSLTAPPPEGPFTYTVFNGKRLRDYAYQVLDEVELATAIGPLRTLRLERTDQSDGRFEVWLAIDHYYLPVRLLRSDDKGNEVELSVLSIAS
jgi:hypothetical protein